MKAKDLAEILLEKPNAEVRIIVNKEPSTQDSNNHYFYRHDLNKSDIHICYVDGYGYSDVIKLECIIKEKDK